MAWLVVNKNGEERIFDTYPFRDGFSQDTFWRSFNGPYIPLPQGSIKKLIGKKLTWEDEPFELK